ncbi:hypothetical protein M3Y94_01140000 [Aphelenchoides besseyi]|nr:hypothetical protein M3Y94_01140000 [Aphelenchoides besseyi]KAI6227857.1 hypothetical protein M3Y95_00560700 [Aphelenchoides besseyi]
MAESMSATTSSSGSAKRRKPRTTEVHLSVWYKFSRIIFGKIRRLPRSMSTTLVLFTIHMYLTVPVIVACGMIPDLRALLGPFRAIKASGFQFDELDEFREIL